MIDKMKELSERVLYGQIRVSILALFVLLVIAIVAMTRLQDPENIIINIILVISGIVGVGIGGTQQARKTDRTTDPPKE